MLLHKSAIASSIAVPLNWWYLKTKNRHIKLDPTAAAAAAAMREHQRTDRYLTLSQAKAIYPRYLTGVKVRRHLFWRYSVVWQKPCLRKN